MGWPFPVPDDGKERPWPANDYLEVVDYYLDQDDGQQDGEDMPEAADRDQGDEGADSQDPKKPR